MTKKTLHKKVKIGQISIFEIIIYNYAEWPLLTIRQLGDAIKKFFNIPKPIPVMPKALLVPVAYILNKIGKPFNKFQDIHPVQVKKQASQQT